MSNMAVAPLMIMPTKAVHDTAMPSTWAGSRNLCMLSRMMAPTATSSMMALSSDMSTVLFFRP